MPGPKVHRFEPHGYMSGNRRTVYRTEGTRASVNFMDAFLEYTIALPERLRQVNEQPQADA